jgi:signal transduction histidine kinase/CheY-like chemotaxis protein
MMIRAFTVSPFHIYAALTSSVCFSIGMTWNALLSGTGASGSIWMNALSVAAFLLCATLLVFQIIHREKEVRRRLHQETRMHRQAMEKALAFSHSKSEFLANMSHEIRTPLNSMIGISELLLDSELSRQQEQHLRTVLSSAESLLELINDILDFSKIEAGRLELEPVSIDLASTVADTMDMFLPRLREKQHRLELLVDYDLASPKHIIADPVRIRQILCNLLSNAIKFTESGHIMLSVVTTRVFPANPAQCELKITVSDTGIGIPADQCGRIFDKFTQADASTTRKFGGTGLGLAICQQLVALMGGQIGLESMEGKGSTFWFTMPCHIDATPIMQDIANHGILHDHTAWVVDDLDPSREILANLLTHAGMKVIQLNSSQALEYIDKSFTPPDLLLSEFMFDSATNGLELMKQLRKLNPHLVSIIATGHQGKGLSALLAEAGCHGYLPKPVRGNQLLDICSLALSACQQGQPLTMLTPLNLYHKQEPCMLPSLSDITPNARVLLVEDNRVNREFATELLERMGCKVVSAANGEEAIRCAYAHPLDIILMDCQMPVMDGFEASKHLSSLMTDKKLPNIPIIALTANAMKGDREACLASGMSDYLSKPLRRHELISTLQQWLPKEIGS